MKSKYLASDFCEEAHNHTIYIFGWTYFFNRLYTVLTPHPATTSFLLVHLTPSYYGSYTTLSITAHHLTLHTHLTALFKGQLQSIDIICHPLSDLKCKSPQVLLTISHETLHTTSSLSIHSHSQPQPHTTNTPTYHTHTPSHPHLRTHTFTPTPSYPHTHTLTPAAALRGHLQ